MVAALQRLAVHLEEEPFVGPQARIRESLPHLAHELRIRVVTAEVELGERGTLLALDRADDLDEQSFLRAEVVDEHAMARADRGGELAKAQVAEPAPRDVRDRRVEEALLRAGFLRLIVHAPHCTVWYMYRTVRKGAAV